MTCLFRESVVRKISSVLLRFRQVRRSWTMRPAVKH